MEQKAISVRQPWAWLLVNGYKDIENRTWSTKHRGETLIHASKKVEKKALGHLKNMFPDIPFPEEFETGGIVGSVNIWDCVTESSSIWKDDSPYGFAVHRAKPLPFFPYKGKLGFFNVDMPEPSNA